MVHSQKEDGVLAASTDYRQENGDNGLGEPGEKGEVEYNSDTDGNEHSGDW